MLQTHLEHLKEHAQKLPEHHSHEMPQGLTGCPSAKTISWKTGEKVERPGVGNAKLMKEANIDLNGVSREVESLIVEGKTLLFLSYDHKLLGIIALADVIKPNAHEAIEKLHELGLRTLMLSGDNKKVASVIAKKAGISDVVAEILPQDKANIVKQYQQKALRVGMVGDGINDAHPCSIRCRNCCWLRHRCGQRNR